MSIKKYHKSANLFNVSDYSVGTILFITKQIVLEPNTTYTMSSNCPLYNGGALIAMGNIDESLTTANNGVYPNHPITRTTDANGKLVIGLRTNGSDYIPADYETMLNSGSTALPYEPYDPEVWHSIPYRKYGTETDAITTLPATVIGDGTPISSYTIKGNLEQSGTPTPTPSSPIYPSECGERTENLFDYQTMATSVLGSYLDATGQEATFSDWNISDYIPCDGKEFTINKIGGNAPAICLYDENKQFLTGKSYQSGGAGLKTPVGISSVTNAKYIRFSYYTLEPFSDKLSEIVITEGSTAPASYIPYGYKLPLTLGSTTTNIYLGEVQSTRRIKKLVLTGSEGYTWYRSGTRNYSWYIQPSTIGTIANTPFYCSHGETVTNESDFVYGKVYCDNMCNLGIFDSSINSTTELNNYFAQQYANGTPVTIWYVLTEPETGIVNEPIRKIGDYVDSVSGTSLATSGTAQEFDVGITLKPSEVDLTYHGWHEHEDTKYST